MHFLSQSSVCLVDISNKQILKKVISLSDNHHFCHIVMTSLIRRAQRSIFCRDVMTSASSQIIILFVQLHVKVTEKIGKHLMCRVVCATRKVLA